MTTSLKAGRYEIIGELGRGAMGVVYKATDPVIGRTVAVKTIKLSEEGTGMSRPELLTRFQTEARAAGLLTHPNIVVVFDAGEEDGLYYITMELVEGKSLQAHLDERQTFALPRVLRIMEQTCSALQFAHERNVVHRDIKPANIMLTADDTVKVTDFGTAKILQFGTMQQTAHVMGTPSYMSPEQVKGRAVDGRSDIFSLGVMLYEMVTGEKPFPGQNITTVIYKIVNEEPTSPRQIDPTIHPGISNVVMKALAKEPEARYQSCREMLEDLRNYRSVAPGAGPDKTMVIGGAGAPNATLPLGIGGAGVPAGRSAPIAEDPMVRQTTLSLNARAASPTQTPAARKTGSIAPLVVEEPKKKKSIVGSIFLALLLLGLIAYGVQKVRPVIEEARKLNATPTQKPSDNDPAANPSGDNPANGTLGNTAANPSGSGTDAPANPDAGQPEKPPVETAVEKPAPKKAEPVISSQAAEYKGRIEEAISEKGLTGRAKVQAIGSTLVLSGKLRPTEHGALLKFLRDAPANVRLVDHIEYEDAPTAGKDADGHPVPPVGQGAIHILTDLVGATATLRGPAGKVVNVCQTPCSFNDLNPAQYSLEVQKDGYQPMQTALQVKAGSAIDQKVTLESLAKGLLVTTKPPGADVFINGAKQSGQTPVTLPLGPGQYNLVVRLAGYEAYAGSVQVKDNIQTEQDLTLKEKSTSHVAWAQVDSTPKGAEIFIDGQTTGQVTPARVQMPAGLHTVMVRLNGYQQMRRTVQASEGGTVSLLDLSLKPKQ